MNRLAWRRWAPAAAAALLAAAGWCVPQASELRADAGLASQLAFQDFHPAERGFRWSRAGSGVRFAEPGPGLPVRVELELSGWRPPGARAPRLALAAGEVRREGPAERGFHRIELPVTTTGIWSSDLALELRSETFSPGPHDPRALGVRVSALRLIPLAGPGLHRPPLRPLVWCAAAVALLQLLLASLGVAAPGERRAGWALAIILAAGLWLVRPALAPLLGALVAALALTLLLARLAPGWARAAVAGLGDAAAALRRGLASLWPAPALVIAAAAVLTSVAVQRARPVVELDLGDGRSGAAAVGFGALDAEGGRRFRRAERGAHLELDQLGGGGRWRFTVETWLEAGPRELEVVRVGDARARAMLGRSWTTLALDAAVPLSWRAGPRLDFPDAQPHLGLRVARVVIDRSDSLPAPRLVALLALAALALAAVPGALGAGRAAAALTGLGAAAAAGVGLALEPVATAQAAGGLLAIAVSGLLLTAVAASLQRRVAAHAAALPLPALVGPALGWCGWLTALTFPLYRGGHFRFHAGIGEEIWNGRFWVYYLPYPGSMLSRQEHWGDLIFPHPCSFHVLVAPLAALGHPAFFVAVKVLLASWLAGLALCAALLAHRSGGPRAALLAGICTALLPASYQIVGLGHLMTLLGCFSTAVALTFLTLRLRRLAEPRVWWTAAALLGAALVSYFAAVPFLTAILGLTLLALLRLGEARLARSLVSAGLTGAAIAFALYYVNWAWPFLSDTVPQLLSRGGSGNEGSPWLRLLLQPGKLAYSFGSALVPLAAGLGLLWRTRRDDRLVLWPWLALLPLFSLLDIRFNFLLKHHYFTMVPVGVGLGLLLERGFASGPAARAASVAALLGLALLGARLAAATGFGWIP